MELQIFNNEEFGDVRTLTINGEPWFVGKDVAEILGYSKARNAISAHVDDDDKKDAPIQGDLGGVQNMTIINESGLYSLILSSKLPGAKKFKHWVTFEVLPALRKTGSYGTPAGYSTVYTGIEIRQIIMEEAARMLFNVNERLNLGHSSISETETQPKPEPPKPKQFRTKLGRLPENQRREVDRLIMEASSCEQAAYKIQSVLGIVISKHAVVNYIKEAGLK